MSRQANKAIKTPADQGRGNPDLKDQRAAARTSSNVKAGEQSHKNTSGSGSMESGPEGSTRGGSHEQHVKAANKAIKIADNWQGRFVRPSPADREAKIQHPGRADRSAVGGGDNAQLNDAPLRRSVPCIH
jgi:hypothetical protein